MTFAYVGQAEAPQGKADVIEVKGPANSAARLLVHADTACSALPPRPRPPIAICLATMCSCRNYTIASLRNNTDGAFSLAPLGNQELEWGPANGDVRHRLNISVNNQIVKNLLVSINLNGSSGAPYTIRTGRDENGDLVFNDRPAGIGRNTERAASHWTINTMFGYGFSFGKAPGGPPVVGVIAGGGAPVVQSIDLGPRYRLQFFVQTQNLANRANYVAYSGTQTSPFFGRPTSVAGTRKVETGLNFSF